MVSCRVSEAAAHQFQVDFRQAAVAWANDTNNNYSVYSMAPAPPHFTPRVLFITPELHPLIKTGGLGDVSAALPQALRELSVDVRVLIPGYPSVLAGLRDQQTVAQFAAQPPFPAARLLSANSPASSSNLYHRLPCTLPARRQSLCRCQRTRLARQRSTFWLALKNRRDPRERCQPPFMAPGNCALQ